MKKIADAMRRGMRCSGLLLTLSALAILFSAGNAVAQTYEPGDNDRKVIAKVDPEYPDALKKLYIGGVVRVEVVVSTNGSVKSTKLLGGNPILGQSTMKALNKWKFAPSAQEETFPVKIEFDPHK